MTEQETQALRLRAETAEAAACLRANRRAARAGADTDCICGADADNSFCANSDECDNREAEEA